MRTLDEAIAHAREVAERQRSTQVKHFGRLTCDSIEKCIKCEEEHEQLADWLEELKMLRELKSEHRKIGNIEGFNKGYNKAIDDFMNKLCDHCMQQTNECYNLECPFCTDGCDIVNISEQLKAGISNENN